MKHIFLIIAFLISVTTSAQTTNDMISKHRQWTETHTPKAAELTDEELIYRTACIIQGISHEKVECDLIRACGKWDSSLKDYADLFEKNTLDPSEKRKIKALQTLESISTKVCGKSSYATLHTRYLYACILTNYEEKKAYDIVKSISQEYKRPETLQTKADEERYTYYLLYKITEIVLRLNLCETPDIWSEVMKVEYEAMEFLSKHNIENQNVADIYQFLGVLKGRTASFPDAYMSALMSTFSGCDFIPDHDTCGDGYLSDSRYMYEMSLYILSNLYGENSFAASYCLHDYSLFLMQRGFGLNEGQINKVLRYTKCLEEYLPSGSEHTLQYSILSEQITASATSFSLEWCRDILKRYDRYFGPDSFATLNALAVMLMYKTQFNPDGLQPLISEYEERLNRYQGDEIDKLTFLSYMIMCKQSIGENFLDFVNQFISQYKKLHTPTWKSIVCGHDMANILMWGVNNADAALEIQEIVVDDVRKLVETNHSQLALELQTLSYYYPASQSQKSIDCLKQAIDIFTSLHESTAALYYTLSSRCYEVHDRSQALSAIDKAIANCPPDNDILRLKYNLWKADALLEGNSQDYKKGEKLLKEILPTFNSLKPSLTNLDNDCYLLLGRAYVNLGDMQSAIATYQEGRTSYINQGGGEESTMNNYIINIIDVYANQLNDYTKAIAIIDEEILRLRSQNEQLHIGQILDLTNYKMNILYSTGADWFKMYGCMSDFTTYVQTLFYQAGQSDDIIINYGSKVYYSLLSYTSRMLYEYDRDFKNMETQTLKQKETKEFADKSREVLIQQCKQSSALADEIYECMMRNPNVKKGLDYYNFMTARANYEEMINNNIPNAISIYESAIADARKNMPDALYSLLKSYMTLCSKHNTPKSINVAKDFLSVREKYKDLETPSTSVITDNLLWAALYLAHEYKLCLPVARECYEKIKQLTDINFDLMTESERSELINTYGTGGTMLQYLLPHFASELSGEVYNTLLYEKGLLLRSSERIRRAIFSSDDSRVKSLSDSLHVIDSKLRRIDAPKLTDVADLNSEAFKSSLLDRVELTTAKERIEHEIISAVSSSIPPRESSRDWSDIRSSLHTGDVAIEMLFSDSILGALILRPDDKRPVYVKLCDCMTLFRPLNDASSLTALGFSEKVYKEDAAHLYDNLWAPIEPFIKGSKRIYLSPVGFLNNIAFHAILMPDGSCTFDHYDIYQLTTTAELLKSHDDRHPSTATLYGGIYYGDSTPTQSIRTGESQRAYDDERGTSAEPFKYLPSTLTELGNIWKLHASASADVSQSHSATVSGWTYHTGLTATESSITQLNGNSTDIIHLATHGFFIKNQRDIETNKFLLKFKGAQYDSMIRTGLAMNRANDTWRGKTALPEASDGILTASDISVLDLSHSQLVVMSACETALGTYSTEGVYGLQRGFKQAGVQSIMASLWSVNDNSSSLYMTEFYKAWLSGQTKHEAMRQALISTRAKYPSPYYWAPFVLLDATK